MTADFIIEGKDSGPPYFAFATDGGSMIGPFDTYVAAKQWVREQLMGTENDIASIRKTVDQTAEHIKTLNQLQNALHDSSRLRDELTNYVNSGSINRIELKVIMTNSVEASVKLYTGPDDKLIGEILSKTVATLTERAQVCLDRISEVAGELHTPTP